jgi:DNA-binding MarR family transcriptional regulator
MSGATKSVQMAAAKEVACHRLPEGLFAPENSLPYSFNVVANRVSATLEKMYSERFGLSVVGWRLIAILGSHSPLSAKALSELTAMDPVSTSRALDQLVGNRLVSRRTDPSDRRRVMLRLSKKGEAVYLEIVPVLYAAEAALVTSLSVEETQALRRIMSKLVERSADVLNDSGDWQNILDQYGYINSSPSTSGEVG